MHRIHFHIHCPLSLSLVSTLSAPPQTTWPTSPCKSITINIIIINIITISNTINTTTTITTNILSLHPPFQNGYFENRDMQDIHRGAILAPRLLVGNFGSYEISSIYRWLLQLLLVNEIISNIVDSLKALFIQNRHHALTLSVWPVKQHSFVNSFQLFLFFYSTKSLLEM